MIPFIGCGMHQQPAGLIDDEQMFIFESDAQRDGPRLYMARCFQVDFEAIAAAENRIPGAWQAVALKSSVCSQTPPHCLRNAMLFYGMIDRDAPLIRWYKNG